MKKLMGLGALAAALGLGSGAGHAAPDDDAALLAKAAEARSAYRIAPNDLLSVTVYQDKDMNARTQVDANGAVSLPLAGSVNVAGATAAEAQKRIEAKLEPYLVKPHVSVVVEAYGNKQLFVLGEVQKPGPYPIPTGARVTVLQAITDAGGFTKGAAPKRTHVLRYADGKSTDFKVDLKSLIKNGDRGNDMVLQPNDMVYVPQTRF